MRAEFLACGDARWRAVLDGGPHDFYHLPEYVDLCARQEGGQGAAFWAADGSSALLVPLVLRPLPARLATGPEWRDAVSPYGYGGPLLRGRVTEAVLDAFLQAFRELGAGAGVVSAFLRFHPLLELPEAAFARAGAVVEQGRTVYLDLALDAQELARQTRANHLADARRLVRDGFRVELDDWRSLPEFVRIYHQTMDLREADASYRFGLEYFDDLRRCLGDRLHLCLVRAPGDEAAAAGLFSWVDGIVQFHLSGTADAFRRAGPAKLMLIHMRDWAKVGGARFLHLGGGVGCREDSLAFFKQGFSKLRARFCTFRMILDPDRYRELVRRRGPAGTVESDPDGFFPAYRHP
jgi:hypothetical protein